MSLRHKAHIPNHKRVFSDSVFLLAGAVVKNLRGLIFMPIIIGCVGLEHYGVFVQISINAQILTPFCTMALGMGFIRFSSKYGENEKKSLSKDFWTIISLSLVLASLGASFIYFSSPLICTYILKGDHLASVQLSSLFVINHTMWVQNNKFLKARKRFKLFSICDLLYNLLPYLGFITGIIAYRKLFHGFIFYGVIQTTLILALLIINSRGLKFCKPSLTVLRQFFKFTWALPFSEIAGGMLNQLDRYFIGYFLGPAAIGLYNIAYTIAGIVFSLSMPFTNYFGVYMPKIWDTGQNGLVREKLRNGLYYYLLIVIGVVLILTFYAGPTLKIILHKVSLPDDYFNILLGILSIGVVSRGINLFYYELIKYQKRTYNILILQSVGVTFNIILNILMIPKMGLIGAALSTLFSFMIINCSNIVFFQLDIDDPFIRGIAKVMTAVFAVCCLNMLSSPTTLFQIISGITMSTAFYGSILLAFKAITVQEILICWQNVRQKKV